MTGLFGGTFDPFHRAHLALIESALEGLRLKQLIVMPVGIPPHKDRRISFAAYRYEMARLGVEGLEKVLVSDEEIRTPGIDYTLRTVLRLKEDPDLDSLTLLAGSDTLEAIDGWYRPDLLLKEVSMAVAVRGDDDRARVLIRAGRVAQQYGTRVQLFEMPRMDLSASMIRQGLAESDRALDLCPPQVARLISRLRPYDADGIFSSLSDGDWRDLLELEAAAWPFHPPERRLHAASVAQYAGKLAALYGQDIKLAASAGLLHDLAKDLPADQQRELADRYDELYGGAIGRDRPELMHGPASAILAGRLVPQGGRALAQAIARHSTAHPEMTVLDEILFLADKIAYDRNFAELDPIRRLAEEGRKGEAMKRCLEETFEALRRQGREPCRLSVKAYHKYASRG